MYFYVDESGHTGGELFDQSQSVFYCGLLTCNVDVDVVAEATLSGLRQQLGVTRLHANELGVARLVQIAPGLKELQARLALRFDVYKIRKLDHAIIAFFQHVFDPDINRAVGWHNFWTPLRHLLLINLAHAFDFDVAKRAWQARMETNRAKATAEFVAVCRQMLGRVDRIPDPRARQLIAESLTWASSHPARFGYFAVDKNDKAQGTPNLLGFQCVLHEIAGLLRHHGVRDASRIVVDQQMQFNKAQQTLADFFAAPERLSEDQRRASWFGAHDFSNMPKKQLEFLSAEKSAGLELVDIDLWIVKRWLDGHIVKELIEVLEGLQGRMAEITFDGIANLWAAHSNAMPPLESMDMLEVAKARALWHLLEFERTSAAHDGRRGEMPPAPTPRPGGT